MKIPQQLLAPIVGVLAGCFGIGVGLIIRQPEINELHRQVAKLQKKADELKETVRKQNDEISALITRYRALQVWQVIQKHDLRKQIEESLVFQYAMNDYFSLMVDRLETGRTSTRPRQRSTPPSRKCWMERNWTPTKWRASNHTSKQRTARRLRR